MAPGYNLRHPLPPELTPVRYFQHKNGYSSADAQEIYVEEQALVANTKAELAKQRKQKQKRLYQDPAEADREEIQQEEEKKMLLERLRDLQDLLTTLVSVIEAAETFAATIGSFADEEKATALYLILFVSIFTIGYSASLVPTRIAVLAAGLAPILMLHPRVAKYAKKIKEKYLDVEEPIVLDLIEYVQKKDIIVDDPPECRTVEIFELQKQGLTPRMWEPWAFTSEIYDKSSLVRKAKERPSGTRFLEDIEPPPGWTFSDEFPWEEDDNPKEWVLFRGLRYVEIDLNSYWVYDYYTPKDTKDRVLGKRKNSGSFSSSTWTKSKGRSSSSSTRQRDSFKEKLRRYSDVDPDQYHIFDYGDDNSDDNTSYKKDSPYYEAIVLNDEEEVEPLDEEVIDDDDSSTLDFEETFDRREVSTPKKEFVGTFALNNDEDSDSDYQFEADEYVCRMTDEDPDTGPIRGQWRRRRWVRKCFRLSEM